MGQFSLTFKFLGIFASLLFIQADDAIIETNIWPDHDDVPSLSNGHIGFVLFDDSIALNGLYNGEKGDSHRARIPNFSNITTPNIFCNQDKCSYTLNMRQGFFEAQIRETNFNIVHRIYAHRFYNRAIINRIRVERKNPGTYTIPLAPAYGLDSLDLDLTKNEIYNLNLTSNNAINLKCYATKIVEDPRYQPTPSKVCVAFTVPPQSIDLNTADDVKDFYHITAIGKTEDEVKKEIYDIMSVLNGGGNFFTSHSFGWENVWNRYEISVEGAAGVNQVIHASMFYLISNLPSEITNQPKDPFYGLAPGGLSKGTALYKDYQGHSFWDTEMWMHRAVLLFNAKWSEEILDYRYRTRKAAADNALNTGYKGYRYPWESGFTGREATPNCLPGCPFNIKYQQHITAAVNFAVRAHWSATRDVEWWKTVGCDLAWNTAKFWESRATFNTSTQLYEIRSVMGPDEDQHIIDNNAYTNVIAAINLYFGVFAGCSCKDVLGISNADYEKFSKIARSLTLLYDEEKDIHPQFEGYDGQEIKQADVVLLGYPLLLRMNATTRRNDLIYYGNKTRANGPAMTWSMHTIGFLDLKDEAEAATYFDKSHSLYVREPFKVWSETMPGQPAAGNFITGAGGFLQSVIVGYGGIQLHSDRMVIRSSYLPVGTSNLEFKGITYMNNRFSLKINEFNKTFTVLDFDPTHVIRVTVNGVGLGDMKEGHSITISTNGEIILRPSATRCPIKKTFMNSKVFNEPVKFIDDEWTLGSNELPESFDIPSISNGHVGLVLFNDTIFLNGLYNGEKGESHRARIPNFSNIATNLECVLENCAYQLHLKHGFFEKISYDGSNFKVMQQIYAHRFYNRAIINRVVLERIDGTSAESIELSAQPGNQTSNDLNLLLEKEDRISGHDIVTRCYETILIEDPNYQYFPSKVCVSHTVFPSHLKISSSQRSSEYVHITVVARTEEEIKKEFFDIFTREINYNSLFEKHTRAWENDMTNYGISVSNNKKLNQVIRSSMFYLFSNVPSTVTNQFKDPFWGLSPSGIAKGSLLKDYQGHSFWDTEMWMHPPLLLLNPELSEEILDYRYRVRQAAADNALNTGYKGYRYPWESGFTGREVTPPCCPHVVEYQHHIISDIAFAFRSHLAATHDVDWWKNFGCEIAYNTAKFWESRVVFDNTTKFYNILGVMGPDEFHNSTDNNVYTNVNAAINLYFGDFAGCACKDVLKVDEEDYENFSKIARSLKLLYDEEKDYHPQFEGYDGAEIKQADVVMVGYPLQLPMAESTKRNNLLFYDAVTSDEGPAMTWSMHTIEYLDIKDQSEAARTFEKAWSTYTHLPFYTWSENQPGQPAAGNFITGAGGFLQSLINGYGGIRLHFDRLSITNFYVPRNSGSLKLNGITYLNNQFSLEIVGRTATLIFIKTDSDKPLKITLKPKNTPYSTTAPIVFDRDDELVIEPMIKSFESCQMKTTELGYEYGSAGSIKFSITLILLTIFISMNLN